MVSGKDDAPIEKKSIEDEIKGLIIEYRDTKNEAALDRICELKGVKS